MSQEEHKSERIEEDYEDGTSEMTKEVSYSSAKQISKKEKESTKPKNVFSLDLLYQEDFKVDNMISIENKLTKLSNFEIADLKGAYIITNHSNTFVFTLEETKKTQQS